MSIKYIVITYKPSANFRLIPMSEVREIGHLAYEENKPVIISIYLKNDPSIVGCFHGRLDEFWNVFETEEILRLDHEKF